MRFERLALVAAALVAACATTGWNREDALAAAMIEMQMGASGRPAEIEYHIDPQHVPAVVREAMDALHPGGAYTGAEKETEGGKLYYELTRSVKGMEVEAMFTPDGLLHSEELQVPESKVPAAVRTTARNAVKGGKVTKWEEIRNGERQLVEYHVKLAKGGKKYKVKVATNGTLVAVFREVPAEIEVQR